MLELGRSRCREPLIALRECLAQVAKLLLPIRELAVALLHLALLLVELPPRFRRGLLALPELAPKLVEIALVGRQQLALLVDVCSRSCSAISSAALAGTGVVPILRQRLRSASASRARARALRHGERRWYAADLVALA